MSSKDHTFAAAVACIDGRVHEPLVQWAKRRFGVEYVDLLTQAGPDLALCCKPDLDVGHVRAQLLVSSEAHDARGLVIAGHDDCAANPVSPAEHRDQVCRALTRVRKWVADDLPVFGVWVDANGEVQQIDCPEE